MKQPTAPRAELDVIALSARPAAGEAPLFTGDARLEKLLGITLALATELAVTRERLDTVERLLDRGGLVERREIESFKPADGEAAERNTLHEDYLARVFRVLCATPVAPANTAAGAASEQQATAGQPSAHRKCA